jgi:outer membrane protein assembly factor BamB
VVGNRLYTEGMAGEKTRVWCLDAATGDDIWHYDYELPVVNRGKRLHAFPGPTSTPTVEGRSVYVYSRGGQLFCFDAATGQVAWQADNTIKTDAYGLACSPLIVGEQVIVVAGGSNNLVVAFDKQSGRRLWSGGNDRAAYASPVLFQHKTGPALAVLGQRQIEGLSLANRETLFVHPWPEHRNTADPFIEGDKLLAVCGATGGGKASALFRIPDAPGGLEEVCKFDTLMQLSTPVVWQGFVYGACGNVGRLPRYAQDIKFHCVEFETGKTRWGTSKLSGAATVAAGKLLVLTVMGELVVIEANPDKYVELARAKVVDPWCYSAPVFANGRVYCRGSGDDITEGTMNKSPNDLKGGWLVCVDVSGKAKPGAESKIHPRVIPQGANPQAVKGTK